MKSYRISSAFESLLMNAFVVQYELFCHTLRKTHFVKVGDVQLSVNASDTRFGTNAYSNTEASLSLVTIQPYLCRIRWLALDPFPQRGVPSASAVSTRWVAEGLRTGSLKMVRC